ncbi:MAG TPA: flavin reductase family protein [Flavobacteriaceae bacterium]|nr:flavin reductase [Flavobacteriaceae bacterium]MAM29750.1 flavin reductase [Flavobacteriaceae bacterium]MAY53608.1 flavin reductase [Flavobacteriaceae bacterium]HIB46942.1 flavin reductase family protein [Flavobacteriaceae bacterium]HIN99965.1 flavin reductase family protein [Flavobacteriaceae bacterium]|tara:strand:+ start:126128 stop:127006 length:879 start_codon:yes stop_codon:yes gene_type:complete
MLSIDPKEVSVGVLHGYLLGAVSPRPICFASTVDSEGNVNLSPYSFFNVFSANPPVLIFSPARRVRDNTTKHTLENVLETKEVVVNIVSYAMVQQMSLSSTEYAKGVNEFTKAGFTEIPSSFVKPPRVKEAPVQFECKVTEVIGLGSEGGAGNLVLCEVVKVHIDEAILDAEQKIDPFKIDTVARMGGNWYSRAKDGIFEVEKPLRTLGIGVDRLPMAIRLSKTLTGNDLGMLANVETLPSETEIATFVSQASEPYQYLITSGDENELHTEAQTLLSNGKLHEAWCLLLSKK